MKHTKHLLFSVVIIFLLWLTSTPVLASVDPTLQTNNKFGIHILTATDNEINSAKRLVNSTGGDWGYVTLIIENKDRNHDKWQSVFDQLRRKHLIPIVRIATQPEGNHWKIPYEGEEQAWADFLDNLNWPIQNRYITVYNEPNQGQEWGGKVDPESYAQTLDKTISALKAKNSDFFILNAGFDASAPNQPPRYLDEVSFLQRMNTAVPGIFDRLDGWASHSYPNPGFVGSPTASGKGTIRTWIWEMQLLKSFGLNKNLPVFITETGWKHSEGLYYDKSLPSPETIADNYEQAYNTAWNNPQIIAVTPFLLDYQEPPFDHFSFKKLSGSKQDQKILGIQFPDYYPHYQTILDITKNAGQPKQIQKGQLIQHNLESPLVYSDKYNVKLTFQNTGQSIWNDQSPLTLKILEGEKELGITTTDTSSQLIEPNQKTDFQLTLNPQTLGKYHLKLQLFSGNEPIVNSVIDQDIEVKSPVILKVNSSLKWKDDFTGEYVLTIRSNNFVNTNKLALNSSGNSAEYEARFLLPDHEFGFTLDHPYYFSKTITQKVSSGLNELNFEELEPNFFSALLNPKQFWQLTPFATQ